MKLVRKQTSKEQSFLSFIRQNLPVTLGHTNISDGYYIGIEIYVKEQYETLRQKLFSRKNVIAEATDTNIELRDPKYFSDIEDMIRKYEDQTGKEIEFIYWES